MSFVYDWFSHNIPSWNTVLKKFKGKDNIKALEIGCFEGKATLWLLENILIRPSCHITVIDTFKGSIENSDHKDNVQDLLERFKDNVKKHKHKITIYENYSYPVLRSFKPQETFDIIYVDGSHMAKDVLEDSILSWRLLKKGGIMIFDDYEWDFYENPELCPRIAINTFLSVFKNQYKLLEKNYQVYVEKLGDNIVKGRKRPAHKRKISSTEDLPETVLHKKIRKLEGDLHKIQTSKMYKTWQSFNTLKKIILRKTI